MNVYCVYVCKFGINFIYVIERIDSEVIFVCLINDYSLIAEVHICICLRTCRMRVHFTQMYKGETFYTK